MRNWGENGTTICKMQTYPWRGTVPFREGQGRSESEGEDLKLCEPTRTPKLF
jgi:hypothetical protein